MYIIDYQYGKKIKGFDTLSEAEAYLLEDGTLDNGTTAIIAEVKTVFKTEPVSLFKVSEEDMAQLKLEKQ